MNRLILLFIIFYTSHSYSQNGMRIDTTSFNLSFSINNVQGKGFTTKLLQRDSFSSLIKNLDTEIRGGDFEVNSRLKKLKAKEEYKSSIQIQEVTSDGVGATFTPSAWELTNRQKELKKRQHSNTIIWQNATENIFLPENDYQLIYTLLKEKKLVECHKDYSFTVQKQLPYIGSAVVGGTLLLLSNKHLSDSNNFYESAITARNEYIALWEGGNSEEEAETAFSKNNDAFKKSEELYDQQKRESTTGYIFLGAGIAGYITHLIINKRNQKNYKKYCPADDSAFQLKPVLDPGLTNNLDQQIGLKLTYTFP